MSVSPRILICPLDWGLGHASRDIYIIKKLWEQNFDVIVGADGPPALLIKKELPNITIVKLPSSYKVRYSKKNSQFWKMFFLMPSIFIGSIREHFWVKKLIEKYKIDILISDNRLGLWNKKIFSIYITHQLNIQFPSPFQLCENFVCRLYNYLVISKYDKCWIPDSMGKNDNLTGELSHKSLPANANFIGLTSKFINGGDKLISGKEFFDVVGIVSGAEPQRTIFEKKLIIELQKTNLKSLIVQGTPNHHIEKTIGNIKLVPHLNTSSLKPLLVNAKYIISRAGYTTIMDLMVLKKNAILIPTPGQTEQEYLSKYLIKKKHFTFVPQDRFDIEQCLKQFEELKKIKETKETSNNNLLIEEIIHLKKILTNY